MNVNIIANSILSLLSLGTIAYLSRSQHPRQNPSPPFTALKEDLVELIVSNYITNRSELARKVKTSSTKLKPLLDSYGLLVPRATDEGQLIVKTKSDGTKVLMASRKDVGSGAIILEEIPRIEPIVEIPTPIVASETYYDYIKKIQEEEEQEEEDDEALSTYSTKTQPCNGKESQ